MLCGNGLGVEAGHDDYVLSVEVVSILLRVVKVRQDYKTMLRFIGNSVEMRLEINIFGI